jgi:hypothetical protein
MVRPHLAKSLSSFHGASFIQQTIPSSSKQTSSARGANGVSRVSQTVGTEVPVYWFEKGIAWEVPSLRPVGAADYASILRVEAARGYALADPSAYDAVPLNATEMPLFSGPAVNPAENWVTTWYHLWGTRPVLPLIWPTLIAMKIGVEGIIGIPSIPCVFPSVPVGVLGHHLVVNTASGQSTVVLRYAAFMAGPGFAAADWNFTNGIPAPTN